MFPVPSWYFSSYFSLQKVVKGWVNTLLSSNLSLISDLNDLLNSFLNVICVPNQNPQQTFRSEIWIIAVGFRDVRLGWNTWFFNSGMIFLKLTIDFLDVSFFFSVKTSEICFVISFSYPEFPPHFPREIKPWGFFPRFPRWSFRWKNPRVSVAVATAKRLLGVSLKVPNTTSNK